MAELIPTRYHRDDSGREPAREFIEALDIAARLRVFKAFLKLQHGNKGKGHGVGGISELKVDSGPGYRVDYAIVEGQTVILLLGAGDKKSQRSDIRKAKLAFVDFKDKEKAIKGGKKGSDEEKK